MLDHVLYTLPASRVGSSRYFDVLVGTGFTGLVYHLAIFYDLATLPTAYKNISLQLDPLQLS